MSLPENKNNPLEIISRNSFNFEDEVTYENFTEEEFPGDIVFPHTLNIYLRRRIQEVTSENGCLQKALQDVEEKLENLKELTASKNSDLPETENKKKSFKNGPVSELSSKKKHDNNKNETDWYCRNDSKHLRGQLLGKNAQIKILNEKLKQASEEILETKNVNLSLMQKINKAQKLSPKRGSYRKSFLPRLKTDENLRNLEKERRQQIENSTKELKQAKITLEHVKRKLEASKARIKILENELGIAKRNMMLLNEKRSHDDQLVEVLNSQLKETEIRFLDREVEFQNQKGKLERENDAVKNELESALLKNNKLRKKLEECIKENNLLKEWKED